MFEKIGRTAEQMASKLTVSRRGFLGRVGHAALGVAGVLGGMLVLPKQTQGGPSRNFSCNYECPNGSSVVKLTNNCNSCKPSVRSNGMVCPLFGCFHT
ncbi:MAG: twin-arginine translocation signal domain-containing protein [Gemmataceae bacterium]